MADTDDNLHAENAAVKRALRSYRYNSSSVTYPGDVESDITKDATAYMLQELHQKLRGHDKVLETLKIDPYSQAAIKGLHQYLSEENRTKRFHRVEIDISSVENKEAFLLDIQQLASAMSSVGLDELVFVGQNEMLQQEDWINLSRFALEEANQIGVQITLPGPLQHTSQQRELDMVSSKFKRMRQIELVTAEAVVEQEQAENREVRTRGVIDKDSAKSIDIELQQETEVDVAVQASIELDTSVERSNEAGGGDLELINNFDEFFTGIEENTFHLSDAECLINEHEAFKVWSVLHGDIVELDPSKSASDHDVRENPNRFSAVSKQAAEQMAKHPEAFRYGIDVMHLPMGFSLEEGASNYDEPVLHYNDELYKTQAHDRLSQRLHHQDRSPVLSMGMADKIINQKGGALKQTWDALKQDPYSRQSVEVLCRHASTLGALTNDKVIHILEACSQDGFDAAKLEMLLTNSAKISAAFPDGFKQDLKPVSDVIVRTVGLEAASNVVSALQQITQNNSKKPRTHLVNTALNEESEEVQQSIKLRVKNLELKTTSQLNAVLNVYDSTGEPGLNKLLTSLESMQETQPEFFEFLQETVLKSSDTYLPMMDKRFLDAAGQICALPAAEKQWFLMMAKQHYAHNQQVDFPDLVSSFMVFQKEVRARQLNFYEDPKFSDIENMPVALSRMLSILESCYEKDITTQWESISELSLRSDGAIQVVSGGKSLRAVAKIALPEMAYDRAGYQHDKRNVHDALIDGYVDADQFAITESSANDLKMNYFRLLSLHSARQAITFYKDAFDKVMATDLSSQSKTKMLDLIVRSTTNKAQPHLHDEETSTTELDAILDSYNSVLRHRLIPDWVRKRAQDTLTDRLSGLDKAPPLPMLTQLVKLAADQVQLPSIAEVARKGIPTMIREAQERGEKLQALMENLEGKVRVHKLNVYIGQKYYDESDFEAAQEQGTSVFEQYMKTVDALSSNIHDQLSCGDMIAVISTFNLQEGDANELKDAFNGAVNAIKGLYKQKRDSEANGWPGYRGNMREFDILRRESDRAKGNLHTVLAILKDVQVRTHNDTPLSSAQLKDLLETLPAAVQNAASMVELNQLMVNHVETKLGAYFANDYFRMRNFRGIPLNIAQQIRRTFPINREHRKTLTSVLEKFTSNGDGLHYEKTVKKIAALTKKMSHQERSFFLKNLSDPKLHINSRGPNNIEQFNKILDGLMTRGGAGDLNYFMSQKSLAGATDVAFKLAVYIDRVLPEFDKENLVHLRRKDAWPLITKQILSSDNAKFDEMSVIVRDHDEAARELQQQMQELIEGLESREPLDPDKSDLENVTLLIKQEQEFSPLLLKSKMKDNIEKLPEKLQRKFDRTLNHLEQVTSNRKELISRYQSGENIEKEELMRDHHKYVVDVAALKETSVHFNSALVDQNKYESVLCEVLSNFNDLIEQYPGVKPQLLEYQSNLMDGRSIADVYKDVEDLSKGFRNVNENMVRSLCFHFNHIDGDFSARELISLLNNLEDCEPARKTDLLKIAVVLMNNEDHHFRPQNIVELNELLSAENGENLARTLTAVYQTAPYPGINKIKDWHQQASEADNYDQTVNALYQEFEKHPTEIREDFNGFNLQEAMRKSWQIDGFDYSLEDLNNLDIAVQAARDISTQDLITQVKALKDHEPIDYDNLVAYSAELLYRAKGKDGGPGSTFEINTTQYLAIHSLLKSGKHVTSGIGTGEGKSRIMMICIAAQFSLGKTVDFVTSDVALATRDYLEFDSYFNMLGAETNLIRAESRADDYKVGGINFSDASNLSLFRNKARSAGKGDLVIDSNDENRALMLDEADKTYFDVADTRYNYSTIGELKDMQWVYPVLMDFFDDGGEEVEKLFYGDIDACNQRFLSFAQTKLDKESTEYRKLEELFKQNPEQIESWQVSAMTARQLELDVDFMIEPDTEIQTPNGPKISSEARLLSGNRVQKNSKFSFGVHQCLHARLNRIKVTSQDDIIGGMKADKWQKLKAKLDNCHQAFHIEDEKQIIYSSTSKGLIDDYKNGNLLAVTGTPGSILEREEATPQFGYHSGADNAERMVFLDIPRHRGLKRIDRPIHLTADQDDQFQAVIEEVLNSFRHNQPTLLICETDKESKALYDRIHHEFTLRAVNNPEFSSALQKMQRVHSSSENEPELLKNAGKPGWLTVSTDMIGRGTDIKVRDDRAKERGLKVVATYLPRDRDMEQIIGRAGRAGQNGESRLILDKQRLVTRLGVTSKQFSNSSFFSDTENYIRQQQGVMDKRKQIDRIVKNTQGDFRRALRDKFFEDFLPTVDVADRASLSAHWIRFTDEVDKLWLEQSPNILKDLDPLKPQADQVNARFESYRAKVETRWNILADKVDGNLLRYPESEFPVAKLSSTNEHLLGKDIAVKVAPRKIYNYEDPAHVGRAALYFNEPPKRNLKSIWKNIKSAFKGTGKAFPYLSAAWKGDITWNEAWTRQPDLARANTVKVYGQPAAEVAPALPEEQDPIEAAVEDVLAEGVVEEVQELPPMGANIVEVAQPIEEDVILLPEERHEEVADIEQAKSWKSSRRHSLQDVRLKSDQVSNAKLGKSMKKSRRRHSVDVTAEQVEKPEKNQSASMSRNKRNN